MYQKERNEIVTDVVQDIQQIMIDFYKQVDWKANPHSTLCKLYDKITEYYMKKIEPL